MSSTLPLLLSLADELESLTTQTYPDDFGLGFYPHRHYNRNPSTPSIQLSLPAHNFLERPEKTRRRTYEWKSNVNKYTKKHDDFEVCMDVQDFKYGDLTVKSTSDKIIVEGKHDDREDEHGVISRQFIRKYPLPDECDTNEAISTLSSDGILTVKVPSQNNACGESRIDRIIKIQKTGKLHSESKQDKEKYDKDDKDKDNGGNESDEDDDDDDDDNDPDKIRKFKD